MTEPSRPSRRFALLVALGALSAFGPLSMDLYLPSLPSLSRALGTTDSLAQASVSTALLGLALGQLLAGPASDRLGRRTPVLAGVSLFVVASVLCALAPNIWVFLVLRLLQGLGGAAGLAVSRAVVRDLYEGDDAARVFSRLMIVSGAAPVLAPVAGGALLVVTDWRGVFLVLAVIGFAILVASWLWVPDSLAPENRHEGGFGEQLRWFGRIGRDRRFMGHAVSLGFASGALFVYISMSSLVLQDDYGLSAQLFAVVFAANAAGIVLVGQVNPALISRLGTRRVLVGCLVAIAAGAAVAGFAGVLRAPTALLLVAVFVAVAGQGGQTPNNTALALGPHARGAGSASAVLGVFQFLVGAVLPPLVSLHGVDAPLMGFTMAGCALVALAALALTRDAARSAAPAPGAPPR